MWTFFVATAPGSSFGGPDEGLRYLVPKFIFENGHLPTGYDAATIHSMGNWSYAFYPQFLGPIVSVFFMYVTSLFSSTPDSLLFAARMASVLFGVIAVFFVGKSVEKLFKDNKNARILSYMAMILFAGWPQVAFLSAYVNNDIVALCGVSIIMFACISGLKDGWSRKNAAILAIGFVICLLSYSNSYGFVLFGAFFFLVSLWWQTQSKRLFFKLIGFVAFITVLFAGPFFIRNAVIYNGDVTGMATFRKETLKWEAKAGEEAQRSYAEISGKGLKTLLADKGYRETQINSTIARFGKMKVAPVEKYITVYKQFIMIGIVGCVWMLIATCLRYVRREAEAMGMRNMVIKNKYKILLVGCMIAASLITVALSLYYTLAIDYQPQGRYIIYLLVPLVIASFYGFYFILNRVITEKYRLPIVLILIAYYVLTSLIIYYKYIYIINITQTI